MTLTKKQKKELIDALEDATSALSTLSDEFEDVEFENDIGITHPGSMLCDVMGMIDFLKQEWGL